MTEKLTEAERIEVELARIGLDATNIHWGDATNIQWCKNYLRMLIRTIDRIAPAPKPKTDRELADMLDVSLNKASLAGGGAELREVRDALRARGLK